LGQRSSHSLAFARASSRGSENVSRRKPSRGSRPLGCERFLSRLFLSPESGGLAGTRTKELLDPAHIEIRDQALKLRVIYASGQVIPGRKEFHGTARNSRRSAGRHRAEEGS